MGRVPVTQLQKLMVGKRISNPNACECLIKKINVVPLLGVIIRRTMMRIDCEEACERRLGFTCLFFLVDNPFFALLALSLYAREFGIRSFTRESPPRFIAKAYRGVRNPCNPIFYAIIKLV